MRISASAESGKKLCDVVRAASFHGDIDRSVAEIDAVISAIVRGLDDIGAMLRQNSGEPMKGSACFRQMPPAVLSAG